MDLFAWYDLMRCIVLCYTAKVGSCVCLADLLVFYVCVGIWLGSLTLFRMALALLLVCV